jgi:hypothetical protein
MFLFGIEHEVAFLRPDGRFADFTNTTFDEFDQIIRRLPVYASDYPRLHVGDAGIRKKRWYIEGVERFNDAGELCGFDAKGIEIRTTPHPTVMGAIAELTESHAYLVAIARHLGFTPLNMAFHPHRTGYEYDPPLSAFERQLRQDEPEYQTEHLPMVTFGPDLNLSLAQLHPSQLIDLGRKLTYYSPAIVAFSLNAPIYHGERWNGFSVRTAFRTGPRPAVRVYLPTDYDLLDSTPILTKHARNPHEVGRIEFKACDSCGDFWLYAGLLALLKGLVLDQTLTGRATVPDAVAHQYVAQVGFDDAALALQAGVVLAAARTALGDDHDAGLLVPLRYALEQRSCPAHTMIKALEHAGSVDDLLAQWKQDDDRRFRVPIE